MTDQYDKAALAAARAAFWDEYRKVRYKALAAERSAYRKAQASYNAAADAYDKAITDYDKAHAKARREAR